MLAGRANSPDSVGRIGTSRPTPDADGRVNHADAGQMHRYLNYARKHWTLPGENPPVGLILAASKGEAEAHYALEGLSNQVLAAEYQTALPSESVFAEELARLRRHWRLTDACRMMRNEG